MARTLSTLSQGILGQFEETGQADLASIYAANQKSFNKKEIYNTVYRLIGQELLTADDKLYTITQRGRQFINKYFPKKDGVWKIIIFDIPEKKRYIRTVLRSRLESLGFRKWQNSIWISPYALDPSIEDELKEMAKHYFVRLIKTTDINFTDDLEKLFKE